MATLNGREVLKLKRIGSSKQDKNGNDYSVFSYKGMGFTARPDFVAAFEAGNIAEMELTEGSYERQAEDGTIETVKSWREDGFITYSQLKGVVKNEAELKAIAKEFDLADALATV